MILLAKINAIFKEEKENEIKEVNVTFFDDKNNDIFKHNEETNIFHLLCEDDNTTYELMFEKFVDYIAENNYESISIKIEWTEMEDKDIKNEVKNTINKIIENIDKEISELNIFWKENKFTNELKENKIIEKNT